MQLAVGGPAAQLCAPGPRPRPRPTCRRRVRAAMGTKQAADTAGSSTKVSASLQELYAGFRRPGIADVWPHDLWRRIRDKEPGLVLVDARSPEERQVSVIPGPTVTPEEFEAAQAAPGARPPRAVVCYCTAGLRSANCAVRLRGRHRPVEGSAAATDVAGAGATGAAQQQIEYGNLVGGILAWAQEGLPLVELEDRAKETTRVHVWAAKFAASVPDSFQPVWFPPSSPTLLGTVLGIVFAWVDPRGWMAALRRWLAWARPASGKARAGKAEQQEGGAPKA